MRLDQEAQLVAKNDAKFLAKVLGPSRGVKQATGGAGSRSGSPAGQLQSRQPQPAQAANRAASPNAAAVSARQLASAPTASSRGCHTQSIAAGEGPADPADAGMSAAGHTTHQPAGPLQQQQQQVASSSRSPGSKAVRESPQWLLHSAARSASAGTRAAHGPVHAESSLYAAWAATRSSDDPTAAPSSPAAAAALLARSQAASPVAGAAGTQPYENTNQQYCAVLDGNDSRSSSPWRQQLAASAAAPAACSTAVPGASSLPGSPCSNNYHSTRPAGMAAGISRAGAASPEHQEWFRREHPGVQPPRREDTQQLWQWLDEELQQLKQQLQQAPSQLLLLQQQQQQQSCPQMQQGGPSTQPGRSSKAGGQQPAQPCGSRGTSPAPAGRTAVASVVAVAAGAGCSSSARTSSSPGRRSPDRQRSPGRRPDGLSGTVNTAAGLELTAQELTVLSRGPDGTLQPACVQQQQDLYAAAFDELCRQVSVGCVERGALMAQLWSAHTVLLQAALQDTQAAQQQHGAAQHATAAALADQQRLAQLQEDEKVALRAINERHAAKAEAARQEHEALKQQNDKLQELLKRLSGAQQLVQRVLDLEASQQQQAFSLQQLQAQLDAKQQQLEATAAQAMHWQGRAQAAEATAGQQAQQLGVSTPRPKRDLGLLCDLVEPLQQQLIEQALVGGVPACHVHRLLLGLSLSGQDMRPWLDLAGSCVPALRSASDPGQLYLSLRQLLADCNATGLGKHLSSPEHLQLLSQAVHVGADSQTLLGLLDGSLGLPPPQATAAQSPSDTAPNAAGSSRGRQLRASAAAAVSPDVTDSVTASQTKAAPSAGAALAADAVASVGAGLPLLPLVGALASKYGHDARELGGPVTEALAQAQLSTVARVQDLEGRARSLHKEVVMLKCTLAEQRKHEQERVEAALRDQKRKISRREARTPSALEKFLQTKWGTLFSGIGLSDDLPRVLRVSVPVNNKQMPKREAERLAAEIWAFKDKQDAVLAAPVSLADATAVFLERRYFAIPRLVTEVAYNLVHSLGQHTYDTDCNLFLRVFSGEVDESVRQEQQLLEGEVMRMLKLLDMSINHQATGWLHKADVKTALAGFFKGKKVDRLGEVLEALDTDEPGDAVHFTSLFSDDEDLNQGLTAEIIRSQHLTERLELLQEIEDFIRDAAEDNGTTSLTPAMLEGCLRKAHKRLDAAAVSVYVSRAFGPDWEDCKHRLAQPLGAIIRAVRCGGLPNMVRPAAGLNNVAGAVNRIVPVGKFKNKLVSALKVGFGNSGAAAVAAGGTAARRMSRGAEGVAAGAAGGSKVKSRRATQEAVSAAIAAVLSGDGSRPAGSKGHTVPQHAPVEDEADGEPAAAAAAAEVAAAADDDGGGKSLLLAAAASAAALVAGGPQQAGTQVPSAAASTSATHQEGTNSRPSTAGSRASSRSPPRLQVQLPEGSAAATPQLLSPAAASIPAATPSAAAAAAGGLASTRAHAAASFRNSAMARALTVDVLSAMEAARQSWLKEEEYKMVSLSNSGAARGSAVAAANTPAAAAAAAAAGASRLSLSLMPSFSTVGSFKAAVHEFEASRQATASASGSGGTRGSSSSGGYSSTSGSGQRYSMPAVPALRLSDVVATVSAAGSSSDGAAAGEAAADSGRTQGTSSAGGTFKSSTGGSVPSSGRGSSCGGSSYGGVAEASGSEAGGSSSRALLQQRSVKPILLSHPETPKRPKHVQISTQEDTVFAIPAARDVDSPAAGEPSCSSGSGAPTQQQQQQQQQQQGSQAAGAAVNEGVTASQRQADAGCSEALPGPQQAAAAGASPPTLQQPGAQSTATAVGEDDPAAATAGAASRSSSINARSAGSSNLRRLPSASQQQQQQDEAGGQAPAIKRRGSKSSKHAVLLSQLLLTDADDACAAEAATPAGQDGEHSQVCFTPQAPEQGGKRNAILMRRLNKGKSLKHLEDMMLAVAGGGELGLE